VFECLFYVSVGDFSSYSFDSSSLVLKTVSTIVNWIVYDYAPCFICNT